MTFMSGFTKVADAETEEYKKARPIQDKLSCMFSVREAAEIGHPVKVGDKIAYTSLCGWKEGAWGSHTKGCSADEPAQDLRRELDKKLAVERRKLPKSERYLGWRESEAELDRVHPLPHDHSGKDWNKESVKIGDLGTVVKVDADKDRYDVTWDKHPDCVWQNYSGKDLKIPALGYRASLKYWTKNPGSREALLNKVKALAGDDFTVTETKSKFWPTTARNLVFRTGDPATAKKINAARYDIES